MIWPWALLWLIIQLSSTHSEKDNSSPIKIMQEILATLSKDVKIPEDFGLNIFDFLNKYGYPIESHSVTTEDGYILNLHRIPHGRNNSERSVNNTKPAILLQHGLLCASMGWVNLGPGKSLALMLADAGYDVWLGNNRGNTWSRQHETLDPDNDTAFWEFSFHEFGYYDVPAFIDHILNTTGNDQLYYVGHSQGTSQFFAMASSRPEYNEKVAHMTALAPIAYLHNQRSVIPQFLADNLSLIQLLLRALGIDNIFPPNNMTSQWAIILCGDGSPFQEVCAELMFSIAGEDSPQLNRTWIPVLLSNLPDDTSIKTFAHLLQLIRVDSFKQYDYGSLGNMKHYGTTSAPAYDLFEAKVPIAIYFAENDLFNARRDVDKLVSQLPNVVKYHTLEYRKFSHLDYLTATDADTLLNNELVQYLNNITGNIHPDPDPHKNEANSQLHYHKPTLVTSLLLVFVHFFISTTIFSLY